MYHFAYVTKAEAAPVKKELIVISLAAVLLLTGGLPWIFGSEDKKRKPNV